MEKPFIQEDPAYPTLGNLGGETPNLDQEAPDFPAQSLKIGDNVTDSIDGIENDIRDNNDAKSSKNFSRRSFITSGLSTLASLATAGIPSSLKAAEAVAQTKATESSERENKLLQKIGLERSQVKPEFLKKYFEGTYKAIVIIETGPKQVLNVYDKNGDPVSVMDEVVGTMLVLKNVKISSGRKEMETPTSSYESGRKDEKYKNREGVPMPHAVAIDEKNGIWIHQGIRTGFPASHGCVRLDEEYAEGIFHLAKNPKDLLFIVR